jgi:hypothetical protein
MHNACVKHRNVKLVDEVFNRLPNKVQRILNKNSICFTDHAHNIPMNYVVRDSESPFIYGGNKIIYIKDGTDKFSDVAFKGGIVHETAHAYIACTLLKWKFNFVPKDKREIFEEWYADNLAKKWGFGPEIDALREELV